MFRTKNKTLRNSSIDWIVLQSLPIENHAKPSITVNRRYKTKYPTTNSIRFEFVKKTSIPHPVKSLGYIKYHSSCSPTPFKSPSNSIKLTATTLQLIEKTWNHIENHKRSLFSRWSTSLLFTFLHGSYADE